MLSGASLIRRFLVPGIESYTCTAFSSYPKSRTVNSNNPFLKLFPSSTDTAITRGRKISGSSFGVRVLTMSFSSSQGGGDGRFQLSESSSLVITKGDIARWFVDRSTDAIVSTLFLSLFPCNILWVSVFFCCFGFWFVEFYYVFYVVSICGDGERLKFGDLILWILKPSYNLLVPMVALGYSLRLQLLWKEITRHGEMTFSFYQTLLTVLLWK